MNNGVSEHIASKIIGIKTGRLLQAANIAAPAGIGNASAPEVFFQYQPSTKTKNILKKAKTFQQTATGPHYHHQYNPLKYRSCIIRDSAELSCATLARST